MVLVRKFCLFSDYDGDFRIRFVFTDLHPWIKINALTLVVCLPLGDIEVGLVIHQGFLIQWITKIQYRLCRLQLMARSINGALTGYPRARIVLRREVIIGENVAIQQSNT
jgi:hypothetical protein